MAKYRKIPIIVDAIQYTGELKPAKDFLGIKDAEYDVDTRRLMVPVKVGEKQDLEEKWPARPIYYIAHPSDWILKHEDGSFEVNTEEEFKEYEILNDEKQGS